MEPQKLRDTAKQFVWISYRLQRLIDRRLAAGGASLARLRLLALLSEEPRRSTDVASFFGYAPRTVTQAIDWLESRTYVERTHVPRDRRAKLVRITEAGKALLQQAQPLYDEFVRQTFGALALEEVNGLEAALARLESVLDDLEGRDDA